ncbi:MAG: photosynthetic complex putative assembly protein PuhB [Pseudomonadota bacterium]
MSETSREELTQDMPELMPASEYPMWRGKPDMRLLARRALHVRKVAAYFLLLIVWRVVSGLRDGSAAVAIAEIAITTLVLGLVVIAALYAYAYWSARTTSYTITSERIVINTGIALTVTVNVPFAVIESVDTVRYGESGDIEITLMPGSLASYAVLWPSAKRWHFIKARPMLRALPDLEHVASILGPALKTHLERRASAPAVPDVPTPLVGDHAMARG